MVDLHVSAAQGLLRDCEDDHVREVCVVSICGVNACFMSLPDLGRVVSSCMFVFACSASLNHTDKPDESLRNMALVD